MIIICNKSFQDLKYDSVVENTGCSFQGTLVLLPAPKLSVIPVPVALTPFSGI